MAPALLGLAAVDGNDRGRLFRLNGDDGQIPRKAPNVNVFIACVTPLSTYHASQRRLAPRLKQTRINLDLTAAPGAYALPPPPSSVTPHQSQILRATTLMAVV